MGYQLTDLGTLGGTYSFGYDINNSGHVTGRSEMANGESHAFLHDGNTMHDLGAFDSAFPDSSGEGINDSGQIAGSSMIINIPIRHAFLYENNTMYDLGKASYGKDINESGHVVGYLSLVDIFGDYVHAFIYDGNTMDDIGTMGGENSVAYGINNNGHITGYSEAANSTTNHAFIYNGNTFRDLGTLVGGDTSRGFDINDSGQVAGYSDTANGIHAFFYDGNSMHDLGTLGGARSEARGINNSGHVVGMSQLPSAEYAAFLYIGTDMLDLCTLTNCTGNGWTSLTWAHSINDQGDITGSGVINGETHAFLITGLSISEEVPVAGNDSVTVNVDTATNINVIANDTDLKDGSPPPAPPAVVKPTTLTSAQGFSISANTNGTITYTPTGGFTGTDDFKYTLTDSDGYISTPATVNVTVVADTVFSPPIAVYDNVSVMVDTAKDINVIANDTDLEDGSPPPAPPAVVKPTTLTSAQGFSISANTNGTITYTPTGGFTGTDDFKYTLTDSDGNVSSIPASVYIIVTAAPVFEPPVANSDNVSVKVDTAKDINVIANDTDLEDGSPPLAPPAIITTTTATSNQGFAISANAIGTIRYTPTGGYTGTDKFKYTLTDSDGQVSKPATVNIVVSADDVFEAPVANDDHVNVIVDTSKDINVIANDTDIEDGSPPLAPPAYIVLTSATSSQGFALTVNTNGTVTYTPTGGFTGADSFIYTLTDSDGEVSAPATVNIIVTADSVSTAPGTNSDSGGGLSLNLFYLIVIVGWIAIGRYKSLTKRNG